MLPVGQPLSIAIAADGPRSAVSTNAPSVARKSLRFEATIHRCFGLRRTIMPSAEPLIEGNVARAVVHLERLVMQVVHVSIHVELLARCHAHDIKARVPAGRRNTRVYKLEYRVDRMRRHDEVDEYAREIDHMLNRMHRQSRPRTGVDVVVMYLVDEVVKAAHMDEPMYQIEV